MSEALKFSIVVIGALLGIVIAFVVFAILGDRPLVVGAAAGAFGAAIALVFRA